MRDGDFNMHSTRFSAFGLAALVTLSTTVPVFAESMWIPRLGFSTQGPKTIFVDAQADVAPISENKAQKREARAAEKAEKQALKQANKSQKQTQKQRKEEAAAAADATVKTTINKEDERKHAEAEKIARLKARMEAENERIANEPVDGMFYLYDMTQNRLVFPSQAKLEEAPQTHAANLPAYQVRFSDTTRPGVYDVAVKGSGHRSTGSLVVSDTVYWDALSPTLRGIGKFHCPQETGTFRAVEQCFRVTVSDPQATRTDEATRVIQGGWYQPGLRTGTVKNTEDIARLTRILLEIDALNPDSMKFLTLPGNLYAQSKYPDVLDEASWGLEYLLSAQRPDGSLPGGMDRQINGEVETNTLLPSSANATALGVMALATASHVFEPEELSLSVKYVRAAEKGWRFLVSQKNNEGDPQLMAVAADALYSATHQESYAQAREAWLASAGELAPENALLLSSLNNVSVAANPSQSLMGWLVTLTHTPKGQETPAVQAELAQWVTDQYGYEAVPLVRDLSYTMESAWTDPLQWMASKTGEVATRLGQKMTDSGVANMRNHVDQARLELRDKREAEAKQRLDAGITNLSPNPMDRAYLAYALSVLNLQLAPVVDPQAQKKQPIPDTYAEPVRRVKGFWRPEF